MNRPPQTWRVERPAPVRADAEGIFVTVADLPAAAIGDVVWITGHDGGEQRHGTIAETSEHDGERFFRIELAP